MIKTLTSVLLATAGSVAAASSANAAAITGPGTFDFSGAVNVEFIDNGDGTPGEGDSFFLDFLPVGGGDGEIATLFFNEATGGFEGFSEGVSPRNPNVFISADLTVPFFGGTPISGGNPFLVLLDPDQNPNGISINNIPDDADFFILETVGDIDISEAILPNREAVSALSFDVEGTFVSETGDRFPGFGVFTTSFLDSEEEVLAAILEGFEDQSFSASFEATEPIPEPSSIFALLAVGSGLFLKGLGREL